MKQLEGVKTVDQAVKEALDEFKKSGISYITYSDGKRVPINVYARMALRTARHRAYLKAGGAKRKELGISKIIVSKHDTSCPLCEPFQHKVLIDDVYSGGSREDGDEMLLSEAMERGLFHPNCEHDVATYFEGVNIIAEKEPDKEEIKEVAYRLARELGYDPLPDDRVVNILRKDSIEWIGKLTDEEKRSITKYTYNGKDKDGLKLFEKINGYLENRYNPKNQNEEEVILRNIYNIKQGILKNKLNHDIIIYRNDYNPNELEGEVTKFLSTSVTKKGSLGIEPNLAIIVPEGTNGSYLELLSKYPKRREFLLNSGCKLKKVNEDNKFIIYKIIGE